MDERTVGFLIQCTKCFRTRQCRPEMSKDCWYYCTNCEANTMYYAPSEKAMRKLKAKRELEKED